MTASISPAACVYHQQRGENLPVSIQSFRNNGLDEACSVALGQALKCNKALTCLDLGKNALCHATSMEAVACGIPFSALRDLRLDQNGIDLVGACALVKVN